MQSIKSEIKVQVKEKDHSYLCDANCSLLECYEALTYMRCYIAGRIQEENEKIEEQKKLAEQSASLSEEVK